MIPTEVPIQKYPEDTRRAVTWTWSGTGWRSRRSRPGAVKVWIMSNCKIEVLIKDAVDYKLCSRPLEHEWYMPQHRCAYFSVLSWEWIWHQCSAESSLWQCGRVQEKSCPWSRPRHLLPNTPSCSPSPWTHSSPYCPAAEEIEVWLHFTR